jgi:hypothetical protein
MFDIVKNPIPKNDLWVTVSLAEVQSFIEGLPRHDRAQAYHVMMMTLNACNRLVETEILAKEIFAN